ncbi:hypothetical protein FRB91_000968 [Serendipita sp. 411]|nr:hypothetical protein FRB91_000968 [Serendipita sp. 411]
MPPRGVALVDILHRTFVTGCVGITAYGGYLAWRTHTNTMQKAQEVCILIHTNAVLRLKISYD